MQIQGQEINNIDEAFRLLPVDIQEHSYRVAMYSKIAFERICKMDVYIGDYKAERDLVKANTDYVYQAGLYHDIGKLIPDEDDTSEPQDAANAGERRIPKEHTIHGEELFMNLYPDVSKMRVMDRNMILGGIIDHHETMNGKGTPYGKKEEKISYSGRIVAVADMLDHISMVITDEDPIKEALKSMKKLTESGVIDPVIFKAFTGSGAKLKKAFASVAEQSDVALPTVDQWIKRRGNRPMQLVYKKAEYQNRDFFYAEMRFKGTTANDLKYEDIKNVLRKAKLTGKLAEYFLYEACDALRRFRACGIETDGIVINFPEVVLKQKDLAAVKETVLKDEGIGDDEIVMLPEEEMDVYVVIRDEEFFTEDDLVAIRIKELRIQRGEEPAETAEDNPENAEETAEDSETETTGESAEDTTESATESNE